MGKFIDRLASYEKLEKYLAELPMTWYPALIMHMVEVAYKKNVFLPGGASRIIQGVEKKIGKSE